MPNTKTKKFDFQIFLAVSMILLVICCSVVCIVVGNTENGVAHADTIDYTFTVTDRLYIKNYNSATSSDVENILNYYFGFVDGLYNTSISIDYMYYGGTVLVSYNTSSSNNETVTAPIEYRLAQGTADGLSLDSFMLYIGSKQFNIAGLFYEFATKMIVSYSTFTPVVDTDTGNYYVDLTLPTSNTSSFAYFLMNELLGSGNNSTSINYITFSYNADNTVRCFLSNNDTYYTPVDPPTGGYQEGYQDAVDQLQPQIDALQNQNSKLQTELDRYKTYYDATNWFNFIDSSYNNVKPAVFGDMKTTIKSSFDIGNGNTGVMLINDSGSGQGLIAYLDFGSSRAKGDLVRFSWKDLRIQYQTGSSGPGEFVPVHIAVLSGGSLIDCYTTTEDMMIDGSCEFTLPESASGIYLYNSNASTYIFVSGLIGQYYSYDGDEVYDNGYNNGFEEGKNQGMLIGRQEGYNQGVLDANDYSFFSLFSAVFDAPITAIVGRWGDSDGDGVYQREGGMLNFYIPGLDINFAPFLLSIFTLALIVMIIRFILARKS